MTTLRDKYAAALIKRGELLIKRTFKFDVYSRSKGPDGYYYYLGRSGSVRIGTTVQSSIPANAKFKQQLLDELRTIDIDPKKVKVEVTDGNLITVTLPKIDPA